MTVTTVELLTEPAVTLQLPVLAPTAMVKKQFPVGNTALVLVSVMLAPPVGAGPLRVICTEAVEPLVTDAGVTVTEEIVVSGATVTCAVRLLPS